MPIINCNCTLVIVRDGIINNETRDLVQNSGTKGRRAHISNHARECLSLAPLSSHKHRVSLAIGHAHHQVHSFTWCVLTNLHILCVRTSSLSTLFDAVSVVWASSPIAIASFQKYTSVLTQCILRGPYN